MLTLENLAFGYRECDLYACLNLRASPGGLIMLLGPNGCGKSTLLKLMAGWLRPRAGTIRLDGRDLAAYKPGERARRIGVALQTAPPALDFTVAELVMLGREAQLPRLAPPRPADWAAVAGALTALELETLKNRRVNTLSGGQRQRVTLAAVLAGAPELLLLDEPTSALDPRHALLVMKTLTALAATRTVIMVTHDVNLAARYAETVWLLDGTGQICVGAPAAVLTAARLAAVYGCPARVAAAPDGGLAVSFHD